MTEAISPTAKFCLPKNFPQDLPTPKFQIGDRVLWKPFPTSDFGTIIGLQYAPALHLQIWAWKYAVWLDQNSPSHSWTTSDMAWESNLEVFASTPDRDT